MANCRTSPENENCICTIAGTSRIVADADLVPDATQAQHICCGRVNAVDPNLPYIQEEICTQAGWTATTYQRNLKNHWEQIYNKYAPAEYLENYNDGNWFRCEGDQIIEIDINGNKGAICPTEGFRTDNLLWCANNTRLFSSAQGRCTVGDGIITCPVSSFTEEIEKTIDTRECVNGEKTCGTCPNNTTCISGVCDRETTLFRSLSTAYKVVLLILAILFVIAIVIFIMVF